MSQYKKQQLNFSVYLYLATFWLLVMRYFYCRGFCVYLMVTVCRANAHACESLKVPSCRCLLCTSSQQSRTPTMPLEKVDLEFGYET